MGFSQLGGKCTTGAEKKKRLMSVRLRWMLQSQKFKRNTTRFEKAAEIIERTPPPHNTDYE